MVPRANNASGCSTVTPPERSNSAIRAAVEPSEISVPPCCTNLPNSCKPSKPIPPRISSLSSIPPRLGVISDFLYGTASFPVFGMPAIIDADVREYDHVVLRAQVAFAQFLVREVSVGHAVIIERGAHPAFVLRPRPGVGRA